MTPKREVAPAGRSRGLLDRHLLIQTGKGGTGKTTVTAALAVLAARQGRRVLTCEVNARGQVASLLGGPPAGPEIRQVRDNLWCVDVRPHEALLEYGLMKLRFKAVVDAVLENRLIRYFLQALPSLSEVVMLGKILHHVREEVRGRRRFDLVLLDAPATGHGAALLRVPQVVLDTVPAGPLKDDMLWMRDLLADPLETALNFVTIPEEMPVNETLELDRMARDVLKIPRGVCFLNCCWPQRFGPGELERLRDRPPPMPEAVAAAARMQHHADRSDQQAARLRDNLSLPLIALPQLFVPRFDLGAVASMAARIETSLGAGVEGPSLSVTVRELPFADRRLLVCVGAGGVGKTTLAASVALSAALEGRRVLVCTIDPARRLANSLGLRELGNQETRVSPEKFSEAGLAPRGELFAMMLDLKTAWDDLIARYARSPEQRDKIFANRFYQQLSSALAGSREYIAVEKLYELATQRDYDLVVLDTPPTVHALDFLDAPNRVLDFLDNQAARWLLTPALGVGKIGMQFFSLSGGYLLKSIGRFTGTETLRELAEFMLSLSGMYDGFKERAARVKALLASPETGFLLVTSPNALTVAEALHFHTLLVQEELHVSAVIANRVHPPPRPDGTPIRPGDLKAAFDGMAEQSPDLERRVALAVAEAQLLWDKDQEQIRLMTAAGIRAIQVPWLDGEVQDLPALRELTLSLAAASGATG